MRKFGFGLLVLILGMGMLAGGAFATSYDPTGLAGNLPNPPISPIIWNQGQAGDALYGDIYRTVASNTQFVTFFEIVNTSSNWTAVHIRLRAGRYSIEMIDFPVLLSPKDVFWFQMDVTESGGEVDCVNVYSTDKTLMWNHHLPQAVPNFWSESFCVGDTGNIKLLEFPNWGPGPADSETIEELTQGDVEVFGLWSFEYPRGANWSPQFEDLMREFYLYGNFIIPGCQCDAVEPADVGKYLFGNVFLGDFTSGHYMGYPFRAIKDFRAVNGTPAPTGPWHRDFATWNNGQNLNRTPNNAVVPPGVIVFNYPGVDPAYSDPDPFTNFGPTWNDGDDWINNNHINWPPVGTGLGPMGSFSLDEIDDALVKEIVQSTYFNQGFAETYTLMALSFPTKYLHDPMNLGWFPAVGDPNTAVQMRKVYLNELPITIKGCIFNMDEQAWADYVSPIDATNLPYEVNMVPIGDMSQSALADFCFLIWAPPLGFLHAPFDDPNPALPDFPAGWVQLAGFEWIGALPRQGSWLWGGAPNTARDPDYVPIKLNPGSLLNHLPMNIIPVSGLTIDWENTNYSHSRMFDPSWDNPAWGIGQ
jgi:hypothetical protein